MFSSRGLRDTVCSSVGASLSQVQDEGQDDLQVRVMGGNEVLMLSWFSRNKDKVTALVDTGAKFTLILANPQKFSDPFSTIDGYRWQMFMV